MCAAKEVKTDDVARLSKPAVFSMKIKLCFDIYDLTHSSRNMLTCVYCSVECSYSRKQHGTTLSALRKTKSLSYSIGTCTVIDLICEVISGTW